MKFIMLFVFSLMLTACSQQPNEQNIKKSLEVAVKEENERVRQMIAMVKQEEANKKTEVKDESLNQALEITVKSYIPNLELMIYELIDVKKLGDCEQLKDNNNFKCKLKVTVKNKAGEVTNTMDLSFVRSEGGEWVPLYEDEQENKPK